ncbi:MAG TPA: cysteine desulfurase family protein [Planctomycetota bacterium]|nr:cysteine desulfurase family protein [Planctomycetota bacterium]
MKRVYLDHNATSPLRPEARSAWIDALDRVQGNPSSVHASGREARRLLDDARERVAGALGVLEDEVLFTSGGTEADNLAILGGLASLGPKARLVTTSVEHAAVLTPARELERQGVAVERIAVDPMGRLDLDAFQAAVGAHSLAAAMAANSEVGTLTDLEALVGALRAKFRPSDRVLVFTDAVQALGRVPVDLRAWNVDLAAFSAHKVGGPTGVGVLFRKQGTALEPRLMGGGQEGGLRAGTENVPGIVAASIAIELAVREQAEFALRTAELVGKLFLLLREEVPGVVLNGLPLDSTDRLPNTLNVRLPNQEGQVLVTKLDLLGLQASAGSACASGSLEPSPVLKAMGQSDQEARSGLRLSLGRESCEQDIHTAVDILSKTVGHRRNS